jgi:hypothetical protein
MSQTVSQHLTQNNGAAELVTELEPAEAIEIENVGDPGEGRMTGAARQDEPEDVPEPAPPEHQLEVLRDEREQVLHEYLRLGASLRAAAAARRQELVDRLRATQAAIAEHDANYPEEPDGIAKPGAPRKAAVAPPAARAAPPKKTPPSKPKARAAMAPAKAPAPVPKAMQSALGKLKAVPALSLAARPAPGKAAPTPAPKAPKEKAGARRSRRLHRRSMEEIRQTLGQVVKLVAKKGLRAEQIRSSLALDVREVPRVLREGLATKVLKAKGQKRATTYTAV